MWNRGSLLEGGVDIISYLIINQLNKLNKLLKDVWFRFTNSW